MTMQLKGFEAYCTEWEDALNKIEEIASGLGLTETDYFLDLARAYYRPEKLREMKKCVILTDLSFPPEIIRGMGLKVLFLPGGSFASSVWADPIVPRDTDAVIKSLLGMLIREELDLLKDNVLLLPLNCDSMRKLSDLLSDSGAKIITVELPSGKSDPLLLDRWLEEVESVTAQLERIFHRRYRPAAAGDFFHPAHGRFPGYLPDENPGVFSPGSLRTFISQSCMWEQDPKKWADHVRALETEILKKCNGLLTDRPKVLLIGSPVYFPNFKIPFLIEQSGMDLCLHVNQFTMVQSAQPEPLPLPRKSRVAGPALDSLSRNISPAFTENTELLGYVRQLVAHGGIDGVVFHVIKGQIEYDFELLRVEAYLESVGLPVFRLETDYNYQDLEQLRVRLEAFGEMTLQRKLLVNAEKKI